MHSALFPAADPHASGFLTVDWPHSVYWEESGNPDGTPVLFLHGGPGAGTSPMHRRFFDPAHYRIILTDQRGAGRSTPLAETSSNTTEALVRDLETLREARGIDRWVLFGGSWGSSLALAYAQAHPGRVTGLILRGIFLCEASEIDWFMNGMKHFFPEAYRRFLEALPMEERADPLESYWRRLIDRDPLVHMPAARAWGRYEAECSTLKPNPDMVQAFCEGPSALALARLEVHYFRNRLFLEEGQLLRQMPKIAHLPGVIVQGRYDVICPPISACKLANAWPRAELQIIPDAGHSATEPGITAALIAATHTAKGW